MKFWDYMLRFHEYVHKDHPNGLEGLAAVRVLRAVFEPSWKEELSNRHPFRHRIARASVDSYEWLIQYARKVRTAQALTGFSTIDRRLGDPDEFLSADAEMEIALILCLGGFEIEFLVPTERPTPDLLAKWNGNEFGVEIGSVNPPAEHARLNEAMTRIMMRSFTKAITGGVISRPPTDAELELIDRQVESAIDAALGGHMVEIVSLPGLATIYVAPRDLASALPEDCKGQFRTVPSYDRLPEERISRAIRRKLHQFEGFQRGIVLFLYDNALGPEAIRRLFEAPGDDVAIVLASVPRIVGLGLVEPYRFRNRPQKSSRETHASRTILTVPTGVDEWADVLLWENSHSGRTLPSALYEAFQKYGENLTRLLSLEPVR